MTPAPQPLDAAAALAQVESLLKAQQLEDAASRCAAVLETHPDSGPALNLMSLVRMKQGSPALAADCMRRAVSLAPNDAGLRINLARTLAAAGNLDGALSELDAAAGLKPGWAEPRLVGAELCLAKDRLHQADERSRLLVREFANDADALLARAEILFALARPQEAWPLVEAAQIRRPNSVRHATALAYWSNFVPSMTPQRSLEAHRGFVRAINRFFPITPIAATPRDRRDSRIRIGLASPDFRDHSVAFFIEPVFEHLDRTRFDLFAYYNAPAEDAVTKRLKSYPVAWRSIAGLAAEAQARLIAQDRLDILVDLSGHTEMNTLPVMRYRAAPVQATYAGYPNTTGLPAIHFRLVDSLTDPPGECDAHCTERLIRLDPCFLCFRPPAASPMVAPPPRESNGFVTVGSFNNVRKINDGVIRLWSRVMLAIPRSRLLVKARGLDDAAFADELRGRISACGVDPGAVTLTGYVKDPDGHLDAYRNLDIALETLPYHGTTTTCEALWMGVPVVTLAGNTHASRVGVSLLSAAGLPELTARDEDEYVSIAAALAADTVRLRELRAGLRERVLASTLCDGPGFCRRFGAAVEQMVNAPTGR